ncbi:unnamed protein product [Bursaphelenchus okinawaensis]|uniref:Uncharacterized protein n=1 Tax=Bursaphelenchus okinawaensis TaxID=465554 RepID=A0A811LF68_9BILA|nr:unnamed protein product [Bursaphelenchus okinawaensis]CAG9121320.1 unnamed protein product [Bursaphelenchus okinawaensis]
MFVAAKGVFVEWACWLGTQICSEGGKCRFTQCHAFVLIGSTLFMSIFMFTLYMSYLFIKCAMEWIKHPPTDEELDDIAKNESELMNKPWNAFSLVRQMLFDPTLAEKRIVRRIKARRQKILAEVEGNNDKDFENFEDLDTEQDITDDEKLKMAEENMEKAGPVPKTADSTLPTARNEEKDVVVPKESKAGTKDQVMAKGKKWTVEEIEKELERMAKTHQIDEGGEKPLVC